MRFFRFLDIPTCIDRFEISLILEQNTNIFSTFGPSTDTKSRKKSKNVKNETFQCPKQFKKSLSKKYFFMRFFQPKTFFFPHFSTLQNDQFLACFLGGRNFKNTFEGWYVPKSKKSHFRMTPLFCEKKLPRTISDHQKNVSGPGTCRKSIFAAAVCWIFMPKSPKLMYF